MNNPPDCHDCSLRDGCHQVVWGFGNEQADLMLVSEGPGRNEDEQGRPMVGQSGQELTRYLRNVGIDKANVFIDNVVKCRPPNDRDPKVGEIEACSPHLLRALEEVKPKIIVTLGAVSTRWFLPGASLEQVHGIPFHFEADALVDEVTIFPTYHPAAALRNTGLMATIQEDFKVLAKVIRGEAEIGGVQDAEPNPDYNLLEPSVHEISPPPNGVVAVDTETIGFTGEPWCLSFSASPGTGHVILATNKRALEAFAWMVANPKVTVLLHNALFDLPVLAKMKVFPANPIDTMVGAYNTQKLPQGLKTLAYRLVGMEMGSYQEQVAEATNRKAMVLLKVVCTLPPSSTCSGRVST